MSAGAGTALLFNASISDCPHFDHGISKLATQASLEVLGQLSSFRTASVAAGGSRCLLSNCDSSAESLTDEAADVLLHGCTGEFKPAQQPPHSMPLTQPHSVVCEGQLIGWVQTSLS